MQIANKHMTRCSTSLVSREMQSKIAVKYFFILTRIVVLLKKRGIIASVGENVEKLEPSYTTGRNITRCNHL